MQQIVLIFHVLTCFALIALIVMQRGKGAEAGAAFGSGASQTVFGSRGAGTFLIKITGILAAIFFATSILLNYLSTSHNEQNTLESLLPATTGEIPLNNTLKIQDKNSSAPLQENKQGENNALNTNQTKEDKEQE